MSRYYAQEYKQCNLYGQPRPAMFECSCILYLCFVDSRYVLADGDMLVRRLAPLVAGRTLIPTGHRRTLFSAPLETKVKHYQQKQDLPRLQCYSTSISKFNFERESDETLESLSEKLEEVRVQNISLLVHLATGLNSSVRSPLSLVHTE